MNTKKLTQDEIQKLKNAHEADDQVTWNKLCDDIKQARGGQYPSDWFAVVIDGIKKDEKIDIKQHNDIQEAILYLKQWLIQA